MSKEKEIEPHYQERAKDLVDTMFDANLFNKRLSRDGLQVIEDAIAYEYQCMKDATKRNLEFIESMKEYKD